METNLSLTKFCDIPATLSSSTSPESEGSSRQQSHLATAKHPCTYLSIPYMNTLKMCEEIIESKTRGSHSKRDPADRGDFVCTIQRNSITTYNTYIKKCRFFCLYFNHLILPSNIRFNLRYSLKVLFSDTQQLAEFKKKSFKILNKKFATHKSYLRNFGPISFI